MCFNTKVEAPAPRNIAQETGETLQTQINLAPQQLDAYRQTAPGYAQTDLDILGRSLFGDGFTGSLSDINRRLTTEAAEQSSAATAAQREADLADVQRLGGTVQSLQRGANTELFGNLAALDQAAANAPRPGSAGQPDYAAYVRANPDLLRNWETNTSRNTNLTLEQYGRQHYEGAGRNEGRVVPIGGATPGTLGTAGTAYINSTRTIGTGPGSQPLTLGDYTPAPVTASFNPQQVTASFNPQPVSTDYTPGLFGPAPADISAERVSNALTAPANPSAIESALERQALDELALGQNLSADEARQVRVQSRAAADARGRGFSNAALADEVLNTANARQARLNARRGFALTTNEALRTGQAADRSYGLARDTFRAGVDTTNANLGLEAARTNATNRLAYGELSQRDRQFAANLSADNARFNVSTGLSAAQLASENQRFNSGLGLSAAQLASENQRFNSGLGLSAAELNSRNRLGAATFNAGRTDADRLALAQAAAYEQQLGDTAFQRQLAATQARLATYTDPFQGVLGRASTNAGSNAQLFGNAAGTAGASAAQTRSMFDPFNSYAADLYNTNYNGAAAAGIATANNRAGILGGLFEGAGALGGAALFCWLAREVYGPHDPRWLRFRAWMLSRAPLPLLAAYIVRGRTAAARAHRDPAYRTAMRNLMDAVLALQPQPA